jgi:hypothetical protein
VTSFLERYVRGDCLQVWDELLALGEAVRDEPLYTDARAVAHETMQRVRANLEMLIPRLRAVGYDFGYAWLAAEAEWEAQHRTPLTAQAFQQMRDMGVSEDLLQEMAEHDGDEEDLEWKRAFVRQPHPILQPPAPEVREHLRELERLVGPIPLSLAAWYEQVGAVDFVGVAPDRWGATPILVPPGSATVYQLQREATTPGEPSDSPATDSAPDAPAYSFQPVPLGPDQGASGECVAQPAGTADDADGREWAHLRPALAGAPHDLDPLYVYPLETVLQSIRWQVAHQGTGQSAGTSYVELAPDEYFKYFVSGGGPYAMRVPDARVDAPLEGEWHQTTFVNYLRICLEWAGFPGLVTRTASHNAELARLREGLLPM